MRQTRARRAITDCSGRRTRAMRIQYSTGEWIDNEGMDEDSKKRSMLRAMALDAKPERKNLARTTKDTAERFDSRHQTGQRKRPK